MSMARTLSRGALAGVLATLPMSGVMLLGHRVPASGTVAPLEITRRLMQRGGRRREAHAPAGLALASVAHLGFGAAAGAAFGVMHTTLRPPGPRGLHGLLFGTLVWFGSYVAVLPRLHLMPEPDRDHPARPILTLFAHFVYGLCLEFLTDALALHRGAKDARGHAIEPAGSDPRW